MPISTAIQFMAYYGKVTLGSDGLVQPASSSSLYLLSLQERIPCLSPRTENGLTARQEDLKEKLLTMIRDTYPDFIYTHDSSIKTTKQLGRDMYDQLMMAIKNGLQLAEVYDISLSFSPTPSTLPNATLMTSLPTHTTKEQQEGSGSSGTGSVDSFQLPAPHSSWADFGRLYFAENLPQSLPPSPGAQAQAAFMLMMTGGPGSLNSSSSMEPNYDSFSGSGGSFDRLLLDENESDPGSPNSMCPNCDSDEDNERQQGPDPGSPDSMRPICGSLLSDDVFLP